MHEELVLAADRIGDRAHGHMSTGPEREEDAGLLPL